MVNTDIRLIIFFAAKDGQALYSQQKQDQKLTELLIAKFRLKLKKVGETVRPFRYDLNQNPYDYTEEVRNRFKGVDLIDRMPDELWTEVHDIVLSREICIYTWASLVAQLVKNPPVIWETWVLSLGWEDPLDKGKATQSSIQAWRIPWTVESMGLQSWTRLSNFHSFTHSYIHTCMYI